MSNEEAVKMLRTMLRTVYLGNRKFEDAIECAIKALSEPLQPWEVLAAQAVLPQPEIVRCGECKWFQCNMSPDGYLPQGVDEFECRHWCGSCDPTDFCSYAERREVTDS